MVIKKTIIADLLFGYNFAFSNMQATEKDLLENDTINKVPSVADTRTIKINFVSESRNLPYK